MDQEGAVQEGQIQDGAASGDGQPGVGSGGQQFDQGQYIPKQQYDKVWGRYQTYHKEFGKPEEVREKMARLKQYDEAIERYRKGQSGGNDLGEIRNRLLEVYPELRNLEKLQQYEQEIAELRSGTLETRMEKASGYLSEKLKAQGLSLTPEEQEDFEDILVARMDEDELDAFQRGDFTVLDQVLASLPKTGIFGRLAAKNAPPKPPSRLGSQGAPAHAAEKKPADMKEALDRAWDRLSAKE